MLGYATFDIWACGGGGYIILIKTFVVHLLIKKMLRVVHEIIIQGYSKYAD